MGGVTRPVGLSRALTPMRRVLRNYLISFLIIALFALAVLLIDRWADERESRKLPAAAPPAGAGTQSAPTPASPAR